MMRRRRKKEPDLLTQLKQIKAALSRLEQNQEEVVTALLNAIIDIKITYRDDPHEQQRVARKLLKDIKDKTN